ncbi:MAG: nucleotide sugar dehydrogenase, partial [Phycisphaerales bacterium]|nr:nucleotide sugar dehydrogenase [Phycisphaerales bacterium]
MSDPSHDLIQRIEARRAHVAVIGLGYVGLPLLHAVLDAGFPATGIDHDADKIRRLRAGQNYLPHLGDELARRVGAEADLHHVDGALADADVILICVPTPLSPDRTPDLQFVERASRAICQHRIDAHPGRPCLVSLESTTWPGTCREVIAPVLGAASDGPVHIAFSPEREDPGNRRFTTTNIPKLVGGLTSRDTEIAEVFYRAVVDEVVPCRTSEVAEAAKLVENVYRSVNIALVNELKLAFEAMGLDVWEILDAAATKPFGYQRFDPGPGFGGHCVPIDPYYLAWKARAAGVESRFIELAGDVNRDMPRHVVHRCAAALAESDLSLAGAGILVLGIAYKKNV